MGMVGWWRLKHEPTNERENMNCKLPQVTVSGLGLSDLFSNSSLGIQDAPRGLGRDWEAFYEAFMTKDGKPETIKELTSMGGLARAEKLSKRRRKEIASEAGKASWRKSSLRFKASAVPTT